MAGRGTDGTWFAVQPFVLEPDRWLQLSDEEAAELWEEAVSMLTAEEIANPSNGEGAKSVPDIEGWGMFS